MITKKKFNFIRFSYHYKTRGKFIDTQFTQIDFTVVELQIYSYDSYGYL